MLAALYADGSSVITEPQQSRDHTERIFKLFNAKKEEESIIKFEDVEQIVIYCAPSVKQKRSFKILPFEHYHFARIFTKDFEKYVITSLLMEDIVDGFKVVPNIKIKYKIRIFATTLY